MESHIQQVAERQSRNGWTPPVICTTRSGPAGFALLDKAIRDHAHWRATHTDETAVRRARARYQAHGLIARRIDEILEDDDGGLLDLDPRGLFDALHAKLKPDMED